MAQSHSNPTDRILALTGKKRWEDLVLYLQTPEGRDEAGRIIKIRFGKFKLNILHAFCWFGAPLDVVELIPTLDVLASEKDACDRTALHLCILHSQCIEVVRHVRDANPDAVLAKDDEGRTPLLCFCGRLETEDIFEGATALIKRYDDLVNVLVEKRPSSVLVEDDEGVCAIERAICAGSPRKIIKSMQKYAVYAGRSSQQGLSCNSFSSDDLATMASVPMMVRHYAQPGKNERQSEHSHDSWQTVTDFQDPHTAAPVVRRMARRPSAA